MKRLKYSCRLTIILVPLTPLADGRNLVGQVRHPCAARSVLEGITLVKAPKVVFQLGIGSLDEIRQRGPRKITVLVVDRFDPRPIDREQLPAE
jgi:hypothetical protein